MNKLIFEGVILINKKGEPRRGGMPLGWKKPEGTRKQRQLRAYDDEWTLIQQFAKIIKHGDRPAAEKLLASLQ